MISLKDQLESHIDMYASMGHPALCERLIHGHGVEFAQEESRVWNEDLLEQNQCFKNCAELVLSDRNLRYVEGYVMCEDYPLLIEHAWVLRADGRWFDPTLRQSTVRRAQYMGLVVHSGKLMQELDRTGVYGLLDTGAGVNVPFVLQEAPELMDVIKRVSPNFAPLAESMVQEAQPCL
jgi:hypothetical protein